MFDRLAGAVGTVRTFERRKAFVHEELEVAVAQVAAGAGRPEEQARHADVLGSVQAEAGDVVGHDARHRRRRRRHLLAIAGGVVVEAVEQALEVREAGLHGGVADRGGVLRSVGVRVRQAVRDGGEAEAREARDGLGAPGPDQAAVVVLGVDEGDVEALAVEDLGQLHHRRHVALRRERDAHRVRLGVVAGCHLSALARRPEKEGVMLCYIRSGIFCGVVNE